jgi:hypothetical protein
VGDQPDRAAGLDGTQLLVIADQPHIGAAAQGVADDLVQGVDARHGGLVDDQDVAGTEVELMLGETELQGGGDLVPSVWGGVDGLAKFLGGAARGVPSPAHHRQQHPDRPSSRHQPPAGCLPLIATSAGLAVRAEDPGTPVLIRSARNAVSGRCRAV